MNSTFGMFYYALLPSYLAFVDWPKAPLQVRYDEDHGLWGRSLKLLRQLDTAGTFNWVPFDSGEKEEAIPQLYPRKRLLLLDHGKSYSGFEALKRILLFTPFLYFFYVDLLGRQPHFFQYHRWLAAAVLAVFTPFLSPAGEAAYNWMMSRRSSSLARVTEEKNCKKEMIVSGQN